MVKLDYQEGLVTQKAVWKFALIINGALCGQMWDTTNAGVVCRQLGLTFTSK